MAVIVQAERWHDAYTDVLPIWQGAHAAETVAKVDAQLVVNPALEALEALDDADVLLLLTARSGKRLVGYVLTLFLPDFSCKHLLMANVMLHFVDPAWRGQGIARDLFSALTGYATVRQCAAILVGNKAHLPHGAIFERMGYHVYGTTYIRWLHYETQTVSAAEAYSTQT